MSHNNTPEAFIFANKKTMKTLLNWSFVLLVFGLMSSCGSTGQATADTTTDENAVAKEAHQSFGADFEPADVVAYEDLAGHVTEADSLSVVVKGKVSDVCQAKGCWMNITQADGAEMMVKFKDYGFFMPKDIAGREVIMNGKAFYRVTPVDELRHYAEDAGKSQEEIAAITEPKRELAFLADGVILLND